MPYPDGLPAATALNATDLIVVCQGTTGIPGSGAVRSATLSQITVSGYTLPTATATILGGVKPDGTTITNTAGVLHVAYGTAAATAAQGNDSRITGALAAATAATTYAPLASPALTGAPTAPTQTLTDNTTKLATTAYVKGQNYVNAAAAAAGAPVQSVAGRTGAVTLANADVSGSAGLASPTFTGTPAAPTATAGTNTTQLATTQFVTAAVVASTAGVASFNTRTGAVTLTSSDVTTALTYTPYDSANPAGYAQLASPTFTGTPAVPTAIQATSTTQAASTAFVRTGTHTNDDASAGQVGEYQSATRASGSAISLTSNTAIDIVGLTLSAGDWDVSGAVVFSPNGATVVSAYFACVNTVANTFPAMPASAYVALPVSGTGIGASLPTGTTRVSLVSSTSVYVIGQASFASSTMAAYGIIRARRVR